MFSLRVYYLIVTKMWAAVEGQHCSNHSNEAGASAVAASVNGHRRRAAPRGY